MTAKTKTKLDQLTGRLNKIKAKDIMTKDVIVTSEDQTLADVAQLMIKARISGLPVVSKKNKVVGVITATDLFLVMDMIGSGNIIESEKAGSFNPTVRFAMSTDVFKIKKNTTLNEIIAAMKYRNLHTIPVFEGNKMVGVIGRRDIFKNFYATLKDLD